MKKIWFDEAWEDYCYWQTQDKKTLKRINILLKDNRLVYRIRDGVMEIVSCKGHYED